MAVPSFDRFVEPLLRLLAASPSGIRVTEAYDKLAQQLKLTDDERAALLPSGNQPVYENRIGWARDRLRRAEYMTSPSRGLWQITDAGRAFIAAHKRPLTEEELRV